MWRRSSCRAAEDRLGDFNVGWLSGGQDKAHELPSRRKSIQELWSCKGFIRDSTPPRTPPSLETNLASRWEGVRLSRASGKSLDFPRSSPNFPGSFSATSPEVLSLWNLTAIQGFPGSFPDFPASSPDFPGSFPDFPRGQPLSLGSLTPSLDSQKLGERSRGNTIRGNRTESL